MTNKRFRDTIEQGQTMTNIEFKHRQGDVIEHRASGKAYKVMAAFNYRGEPSYAVRGWRGGKWYGPTRTIAEKHFNLFRIETEQDHDQ